MNHMLQVTYIGNFLSKHGLNPTYSECLAQELVGQNISIRTASSYMNPFVRLLDMLSAIWQTPRKNSCIIIDLYSGARAFFAAHLICVVCKILRKPYILVLHGGNLPNRLSQSPIRLKQILSGAHFVTSPSLYLADKFSKHSNVIVIPNALPIQNYPYKNRKKVNPYFLYLRAFHRNYNPLAAIKAFSIVCQKHKHARLTMVGPDLDGVLAECVSLIASLQLQSKVKILGRIPKTHIPELGNNHDIFLNPTLVDNTPVSVIEAMAMGMCIVATTAGGLPYLLENDETALLVPPGSEQEMAAAMLRVLEEPTLGGRLSQNARLTAEAMDWSKILPKWMNLIQATARRVEWI